MSESNTTTGEDHTEQSAGEPTGDQKTGRASQAKSSGKGKSGGTRRRSGTGGQSSTSPEPYMYFTEKDLDQILSNLDELRANVFPNTITGAAPDKTGRNDQVFPSVCLIGLGRCGSNIALDVAALVHSARTYYLQELNSEERRSREKEVGPMRWIRNSLNLPTPNSVKPVFLIEPMVMLGDLDKDIEGRIQLTHNKEDDNYLLDDYNKLKIMDLSEVHAGGAGNAPILGQYLAKIILNKDTQQFSNEDWKFIHSYLIDSCGIKANQSRLYFYIFSAGGGTGSGMASEFGLAQQYAYMRKTFDPKLEDTGIQNQDHAFIFEPIFTSGICILPNIQDNQVEMSEALHINAGRLLCKYLSEEWDFSYNFDTEETSDENMMNRIRPWNAMMLISNDIMRYAEQTDDGNIQYVDVNAMEKYANQYISQQIFNILTAQAVTTDYDEDYFRRAGVDIGETIRLDANDLFMSLAGPVAVAYAESVVPTTPHDVSDRKRFDEESRLDIDDLFYRSIDLPHFNKVTQAIEGVSLLPIESERYRERLKRFRDSGYNAETLSDLHFFQNCSSIVSIVSLPKDYKLSYVDLNRLKTHLNALFPNTTLKRYALVIGASANLSLTTLVVKSPCLSDDFLTLITAYIKRCFANESSRFDDTLDRSMLQFIKNEEFDEELVDQMLNEFENPAKILDTNWYAIKPMYEKKYREMCHDRSNFVSINDIRLNRDNIKKAIKYLREIYRHKISKTQMISLNDDL
ncbi:MULTISPECIES: hypothetical protein [Gammaproteobacteria]|uniref:Uncharacterized protein n=1 Tax=Vreelandella halophila TaxID=86177 RepID=A0A9X4YCT8_9GAMM|nr:MULTISPECIES: hypothetical protein [Gammaproteobacteria]KAA8983466.1 hypothetical protein F3089_05410 [Halospina sp. K52047b]MYL27151.1 hypothetical protein [Halomonas utahensis]MYL74353.1 hypothetical protein [Halomonas sp. 22501_18_FS]